MSQPETGKNTETPLARVLRAHTAAGELYEKHPDGSLTCYACGHRCRINEGRRGVCRVRYHEGGTLRVPWGYAAALQCDPIEKKPFFHAYPGAPAMSFGMLGCDLHCAYCQNWITSQALRDPDAVAPVTAVSPAQITALAERYGARVVASTYNEPLITSEWAVAIFQEARARGLHTAYISNGHATPEVIAYLQPWVDLYKVDLKSFNDRRYRELGGHLEAVTRTIRTLVERGFWVEVVTLVVPGFNDDPGELREMAQFLAGISSDIPWHLTAFHADYRMDDRPHTEADQLIRAAEMAREVGLRYVYAGNLPGRTGEWENTCCPGCRRPVVERRGFRVLANHLREGKCSFCDTAIAGRWE